MTTFSIVGAGPGDPELLTIAGLRALQNAEVVLYDRLVSRAILDLANPAARLIYVGKEEGQQDQVQSEIYSEFLRWIGHVRSVVRLKGGDPLVFGRGVEEWLFLKNCGCQVKFIPGISSSLGVPGLAGIPVTNRHTAQSFLVVTGHSAERPIEWAQYVRVDTLVVLMGVKNRASIASELVAAGRPAEEPVAFIERGSLPDERVVVSTLGEVSRGAVEVSSPAVFIVGEVVRFHELLRHNVPTGAPTDTPPAQPSPEDRIPGLELVPDIEAGVLV